MLPNEKKAVLEKAYPEECEAIGPELVEKLVSNDITLTQSEYGQPFGNTELELLNNALGVLASLTTIYAALAEYLRRRPTSQEVAEAVAKNSVDTRSLNKDEQLTLIEAMIELKNQPASETTGEKDAQNPPDKKAD